MTKIIPYPYRESIDFQLMYANSVDYLFAYRNTIDLTITIRPFAETVYLEKPADFVMYLLHDNLGFGLDPFELSALANVALNAIDTFPLNA